MFGRVLIVAVLAAAGAVSACAHRRARADSYGVQRCPPAAAGALLSPDALQCWFEAPRGHWRTLSTESHFDVLVVHVEAFDPRDAGDIGARFVAFGRGQFSEILVYVQPESAAASRITRVRWTRKDGVSTLEFDR
jgi:hypothetical protein